MDDNEIDLGFEPDAIFYSATDHDAIGDRIWNDLVERRKLDEMEEQSSRRSKKHSPKV